jgi:hypothetical protein
MRNKKTNVMVIPAENISANNNIENNTVKPANSLPVQKESPKIAFCQKGMPAPNDSITKNENAVPKKAVKDQLLIMKSGATDLRRGAKELREITKERMAQDPSAGNMHAFANKPKTTIKILKNDDDGTIMVTKYLNKPVEWPPYQPNDKPGHTITLSGKEKDEQLEKLGCPKKL